MKENSNFKANFKAIFTLPKWAKVFLAVLSVVAVAGLITAFGLKAWAADKVESGQLVLKGISKGNQGRLLQDENYTADEIKAFLESLDPQKATQENADENLSQKQIVPSKFAFDGRLYFARLDFLLRSKVIAYIDIQGISWAENIDKNAISDISSHNRHIKFITSQDLQGLNAQNIGKVEYKMDFSPLFKTIIKYYLIISLVFYGFVVLYKILCNETHTKKIISYLTQNPLPSTLWQGYKGINPLYRHTFWIVFVAMNLVFGFHTVQFLWGNHDWAAAYRHIGFYTYFGMGRYTQNIIHFSLLQGNMLLPFLNNIIGFAGFALGAVFLCMYFKLPKRLFVWALVGLLLTLQPFTLARMYYTDQFAGLFVSFAICMLGFLLALKADESAKKRSYALCLLAVLCFHWCIASYQAFLNTLFILLCGGLVATFIDEKCSLKTALYKFRFVIIAMILGAISYKIVFDISKKFGKMYEAYNNQMVSLSDLPERIFLAIKTSFGYLINFNMAFMPLSMTLLFAVFTIAFLALLFVSRLKVSVKILVLILMCGAVVGSQIHNIISLTFSNYDAIHFNGLAVLRVLFVVLAFKLCFELANIQNLAKNLLFVLSCALIWLCVVQDLYAQRTQKLAIDFEMRWLNRVVDRLEQNENFSYDKKYYGLMFGEVPNMRQKIYQNTSKDSFSLLNHTLITLWGPVLAFNSTLTQDVFYDFFSTSYIVKENKDDIQTLLKRLDKAGILDTLQPWPHKNSVVVFEDIVVFVASKFNLEEIRATIKALESQEIQADKDGKETQKIQKDSK